MANKNLEKTTAESIDKVLKEMAENIFFEIESAYEKIIDKFYEDYVPQYYNRTFSIYKASNAFDDFGIGVQKISSGHYRVGIHVSSNFIKGNPYAGDKESIFLRSFVEGIHGFSEDDTGSKKFKTIPPKTSPSPKEQMDKWFQDFTGNKNNIQNIAKKATQKIFHG